MPWFCNHCILKVSVPNDSYERRKKNKSQTRFMAWVHGCMCDCVKIASKFLAKPYLCISSTVFVYFVIRSNIWSKSFRTTWFRLQASTLQRARSRPSSPLFDNCPTKILEGSKTIGKNHLIFFNIEKWKCIFSLCGIGNLHSRTRWQPNVFWYSLYLNTDEVYIVSLQKTPGCDNYTSMPYIQYPFTGWAW